MGNDPSPKGQDEKEPDLITRYRDHIPGGLAEALQKLAPVMRRYFLHQGLGQHVDDLIQDSYLGIISWLIRIPKGDEGRVDIQGMARICARDAVADLRKKLGRRGSELPLPGDTIEDRGRPGGDKDIHEDPERQDWDKAHLDSTVTQALAIIKSKVDEDTWKAMKAVLKGEPAEDIARACGRDPAWAHDVKRRLKEMLKRYVDLLNSNRT